MAPSHSVRCMLRARCETKSFSISQTEMYAIPLSQDQMPGKASPEINLISPGPALRFRAPKQNWGHGGIQATALRGTSKSGSGRIHKHFHYFKPKQQMPFCNVSWQTLSTNISGRLGFYQSHSRGTDPKQCLSLMPLSWQILSLNGLDFYKNELSSNLSHF